MTDYKLKIGDKVHISDDSFYLKQGIHNNKKMIGVIYEYNFDSTNYHYNVKWSNYCQNNYRNQDLIKINTESLIFKIII